MVFVWRWSAVGMYVFFANIAEVSHAFSCISWRSPHALQFMAHSLRRYLYMSYHTAYHIVISIWRSSSSDVRGHTIIITRITDCFCCAMWCNFVNMFIYMEICRNGVITLRRMQNISQTSFTYVQRVACVCTVCTIPRDRSSCFLNGVCVFCFFKSKYSYCIVQIAC